MAQSLEREVQQTYSAAIGGFSDLKCEVWNCVATSIMDDRDVLRIAVDGRTYTANPELPAILASMANSVRDYLQEIGLRDLHGVAIELSYLRQTRELKNDRVRFGEKITGTYHSLNYRIRILQDATAEERAIASGADAFLRSRYQFRR